MKIKKIEIIYDGKYLDNYRSYSKLTITINSIKYHYEKFLRFVHENVEGTLECNVESDNYQMLFEKLCSLFENYNPDEEIHMTCINPTDINIYYEDNRHQNEYGAYLSAACHVRSMFNIDVTKSTEYCGLDEAKCKTLLEVAKNIG